MGKTIKIKEESLFKLKEEINAVSNDNVANSKPIVMAEARPEIDEYEIGQESDNPPIGGNFCHVNESYGVSLRGNIEDVNTVEFTPHENAREEGYETEEEIAAFEPYYEITASSMDGEAILYADELTVEDLYDYFKQSVINDIINKNARVEVENNGYRIYRIDDILYRDTTPSNIDDVEEVNKIAKRIQTGGSSIYLLTDGETISFQDHIEIHNIDDMTPSKFIGLGNIRIVSGKGIELAKEPTREQIMVLRQIVKNQPKIYLDIVEDGGRMYPENICSAVYTNGDRAINDIIRYFQEGIRPQSMIQYEVKKKYRNLLENIDFEVNSSEIDLSSFKKKSSLAPKIWDDENTLNSRVRLRLLDIADDFWEFVNLSWVKPSGIIITGSICNFNWSEFSDIDLHLIVDFKEIDDKTEFVRDYLDSKKNDWNTTHSELKIYDFPIELYVQDVNDELDASGVYDIEENKWVVKPSENSIKPIGLNKFGIKDKAAEIMTIIDDMYNALHSTDDSHDIEVIGDDAKYLWKKVKDMRKKSLSRNGESGSGNIVYKYMRRVGYLDKLWRLSTIVYDKVNSINESKENKEILKEYLDKDYNYPLYKYFKWAENASSCELSQDLAYKCSYCIGEYIGKIHYRYSEFDNLLNKDGEFDHEDDSKVELFLKMLEENNLCDHFVSTMQDILNSHNLYDELPTWCNTHFVRLVKNEWCIHFTKDSNSISKYGFTGGTDDIDSLAYTNAGAEKHQEGYNFAFAIDDRNVDYNEYGNEAVIFRTSGVEIYHYGDNQNQVIFWGPNVKSFIPIKYDGEEGDWVVYGQNGQILKMGNPSEIAIWATENLPQYRKQIMTGKNGYIPQKTIYDPKTYKISHEPYPLYKNESIKRYITLLKESSLNEEIVADGNSEHNPYAKRWKAERKALKDFICNFGKVMTSRENGKQYKCYYDKTLSNLIGYNYCICLQWDPVMLKPSSTLYIRALDKFTERTFQAQYDTRGMDNVQGTADNRNPQYYNNFQQ